MKKKITIFLIFLIILFLGFFSNINTNVFNQYVFNVNDSICFSIVGDFRSNYTIAKKIISLAANDSSYIILTGDYVTMPTEESMSRFFKIILSILNNTMYSKKFFFLPGNHDILKGYKLYYKFFGANNFIIQIKFPEKDLYLIGLDNARGYFIDLSPLKLYGKKIILAHYPIYDPYETRCNFCNLVKKFKESNVILYIASHVHGWYGNVVDGILQIITAGGGAKLRDFNDEHKKYNYLKMCIYDHEITLSLKDIKGSVFWFKRIFW